MVGMVADLQVLVGAVIQHAEDFRFFAGWVSSSDICSIVFSLGGKCAPKHTTATPRHVEHS